ncbi:MAG: helix-turn-helix transcriptional regulator [Rhodospirillales bacterium]|nr:helix-turn-helix transcriptional regulator [Rhodospirillales bacterium]MBN8928033.1 helix-turn-helix transcriptional regulator [Rhodospirillales bacterium]
MTDTETPPAAEAFKRTRQSLGLSQSELAAALGIRRVKTIREIEGGKRPAGDVLLRLMEQLVSRNREISDNK